MVASSVVGLEEDGDCFVVALDWAFVDIFMVWLCFGGIVRSVFSGTARTLIHTEDFKIHLQYLLQVYTVYCIRFRRDRIHHTQQARA